MRATLRRVRRPVVLPLAAALAIVAAGCGANDAGPVATTPTIATGPPPSRVAELAGTDAPLRAVFPGVWVGPSGRGYGDCASVEAWIATGAAPDGDDVAACF